MAQLCQPKHPPPPGLIRHNRDPQLRLLGTSPSQRHSQDAAAPGVSQRMLGLEPARAGTGAKRLRFPGDDVMASPSPARRAGSPSLQKPLLQAPYLGKDSQREGAKAFPRHSPDAGVRAASPGAASPFLGRAAQMLSKKDEQRGGGGSACSDFRAGFPVRSECWGLGRGSRTGGASEHRPDHSAISG